MNVIRASELGSCLKAQVAKHLGFSPMDAPEKIQAAYERGNEHEDACRTEMNRTGWVIDDELPGFEQDEGQVFIRLPVLDGWEITGHLDGIIHDDGASQRIWEAKSPLAWDKFFHAAMKGDLSDPLAHRYAWQISAYMIATGLEAYVTSWDEERGVRGFGIEVPPYTLQDIQARVAAIAGMVELGELPAACTSNDYPCPFFYLHENTEEVAEDPHLDLLTLAYDTWSANEKRAADAKKQVQAEIREHLDGKNKVTALSKVTFTDIEEKTYTTTRKAHQRMTITRRGDEPSA